MKAEQVAEMIGCDSNKISKSRGVFTYRVGFFYRHGGSSQIVADRLKAKIPNATIVDHGEKWVAFKGGAPLAKQSHWWVKFTINEAQSPSTSTPEQV